MNLQIDRSEGLVWDAFIRVLINAIPDLFDTLTPLL